MLKNILMNFEPLLPLVTFFLVNRRLPVALVRLVAVCVLWSTDLGSESRAKVLVLLLSSILECLLTTSKLHIFTHIARTCYTFLSNTTFEFSTEWVASIARVYFPLPALALHFECQSFVVMSLVSCDVTWRDSRRHLPVSTTWHQVYQVS